MSADEAAIAAMYAERDIAALAAEPALAMALLPELERMRDRLSAMIDSRRGVK